MNDTETEKTLVDKWIDAIKNHKTLAVAIVAAVVLLAISGAIEKMADARNAIASFFPEKPKSLSIARIGVLEVDDSYEDRTNPDQWYTSIEVGFSNHSEDPVYIKAAKLNVKKIWQLKPTHILGGGGLLEQNWDAVIPIKATPFSVPIKDKDFPLEPKRNGKLSIKVECEDETKPYAFECSVELIFDEDSKSVESDNVIFIRQGRYERVHVEPMGRLAFIGAQFDLESNVKDNKSRVEEFTGYISGKTKLFMEAMKQTELPIYDISQVNKFKIFDNKTTETITISFEEGTRPPRASPIRYLRLGETDDYATGWSFDELRSKIMNRIEIVERKSGFRGGLFGNE